MLEELRLLASPLESSRASVVIPRLLHNLIMASTEGKESAASQRDIEDLERPVFLARAFWDRSAFCR